MHNKLFTSTVHCLATPRWQIKHIPIIDTDLFPAWYRGIFS